MRITPATMLLPFSSRAQVSAISRSTLVLLAASPLMGWAIYFLLMLRVSVIDRGLILLFIFPFGAHLLLPLLFHADPAQRNYMRKFPFRFYLIPVMLSVGMIVGSFSWWTAAAVALATASSYHVGMQNYGIMRLIDRKLGLTSISNSQRWTEKILLLIGNMLPAAVFSLKVMRVWTPEAAVLAEALAVLALIWLTGYSFAQFARVPASRLIALWSFAIMSVPWAYFYRWDYNELAFLLPGLGHALQYFVCYRLVLSGRQLTEGALRPDPRRLTVYFLVLFALFAAVEGAASVNIERNILSSLIWAISIVHIYYDSLMWRNGPDIRAQVMEPLYAVFDRVELR